jgi:hypothetical protein
MKSQATKVAIAATLVSALIGTAPASAQHGPYILALATGHERTANDARGTQSYATTAGLFIPKDAAINGTRGDTGAATMALWFTESSGRSA